MTLQTWLRKKRIIFPTKGIFSNKLTAPYQSRSGITKPATWDLNVPRNFSIPCLNLILSCRKCLSALKDWKPWPKRPNWVPNALLLEYQNPVFVYLTACLILLLLWLLLINTFPFIKSLSLDYPSTPQSCLITDSFLQAVPVSSASLSNWTSKFSAFLVQAPPKLQFSVSRPCSYPLSPFFFPLSCGKTLTLLLAVVVIQS